MEPPTTKICPNGKATGNPISAPQDSFTVKALAASSCASWRHKTHDSHKFPKGFKCKEPFSFVTYTIKAITTAHVVVPLEMDGGCPWVQPLASFARPGFIQLTIMHWVTEVLFTDSAWPQQLTYWNGNITHRIKPNLTPLAYPAYRRKWLPLSSVSCYMQWCQQPLSPRPTGYLGSPLESTRSPEKGVCIFYGW